MEGFVAGHDCKDPTGSSTMERYNNLHKGHTSSFYNCFLFTLLKNKAPLCIINLQNLHVSELTVHIFENIKNRVK